MSPRVFWMALPLLVAAWAVAAGPAKKAKADRALLSHFYYIDDTSAFESLSRNISAVDVLSPVWFHVGEDGRLRNAADARVKELAAKEGVALHPVIVNEEFRIGAARSVYAPERAKSLIEALVKLAVNENYEGLQLDFENLEGEDRGPYAAFAEALGTALKQQGKTLSVAVVAPLYGLGAPSARVESWRPTGRSQAFDYRRLAKAATFLTVMTYDQYTSPGAPGPIAGIEWMEACLRSMLEAAGPSQLMLGVPLYHRHWAGPQVNTGTWMEAQEWSWRTKTGSLFDPLHQEPVLRFRDSGADHEIWFANAASVRRRLELARQYRLRGFSAWRLGQEDPNIWTEGLKPAAWAGGAP